MGKCDKETTFGILDYFFGESIFMATRLVFLLIGVSQIMEETSLIPLTIIRMRSLRHG